MTKALKKRLAIVLATSMLTSAVPQTVMVNDYNGHWAATAITKWEEKGLVKGDEDVTFRPNKTMTRTEFAQLLVRIFGYSETTAVKVVLVQEK